MRAGRLKWFSLMGLLTLALIISVDSYAQEQGSPGDPVIMRIIKLEYADAEDLALTLEPFLSPHGRIMAYPPTNSLIVKDRQSIVKQLIRVIKGGSDP